MTYDAEIKRSNPTCFVFLVDQSGSMNDVLNPTNIGVYDKPVQRERDFYTTYADGATKADALADSVNQMLFDFITSCSRGEVVYDFFRVGIIGYGATVASAFVGPLAGRELVGISELSESPASVMRIETEVEIGDGRMVNEVREQPTWIEPRSHGGTPMREAFDLAHEYLAEWVGRNPSSYPPIVLNITDGEFEEADASSAAVRLRSLRTDDGDVLLFNAQLTASKLTPVMFPDSEAAVPDDAYARSLFRLSSLVPESMKPRLQRIMRLASVPPGTRGFAFNAAMSDINKFLEIGTRPANLDQQLR